MNGYGKAAFHCKPCEQTLIMLCKKRVCPMTRYVQRGGKIWIRIFPDKPITKRPPETTLGGGKGAPDHYVFPVRPGRILFEMDGVTSEIAREALRRASAKLPMKVKFVSRSETLS